MKKATKTESTDDYVLYAEALQLLIRIADRMDMVLDTNWALQVTQTSQVKSFVATMRSRSEHTLYITITSQNVTGATITKLIDLEKAVDKAYKDFNSAAVKKLQQLQSGSYIDRIFAHQLNLISARDAMRGEYIFHKVIDKVNKINEDEE